jgi:O-antigen ligase
MHHSYRQAKLRFGQIAWLTYFPFLFLPNLGMAGRTSFGALDLSDVFICPYIFMVALQARQRGRTLSSKAAPLMGIFVVWALFVTLLITVRYRYDDAFHLVLSLLKLVKFVLYGLAGMLTARALTNDRVRQAFIRSLAFAGMVAGLGLFWVGQKSAITEETQALGYKASNAVSVMAAIMGCYLCGLWLGRKVESRLSRWLVIAAVASLVVGSAISEGRGGWVAGIAGVGYLCYRTGLQKRSLLIVAGVSVFALILFAFSPVFQQRVQFTFSQGHPSTGPIDDGGRLENFMKGVEQFQSSPILGTGFFHRAGETGLYVHGSHNFFLQMFLETGIPGGLLMLAVCWRLWRVAGYPSARQAGLEVPAKAALIAAMVGGMSGEYFYGSITMFALLAVYAACGSLPAKAVRRVVGQHNVPGGGRRLGTLISQATFVKHDCPSALLRIAARATSQAR